MLLVKVALLPSTAPLGTGTTPGKQCSGDV